MKRRRLKLFKKRIKRRLPSILLFIGGLVLSIILVSFWNMYKEHRLLNIWTHKEFPVTVDPTTKTITENTLVNTFLADNHLLLGAVAIYDQITHPGQKVITITPGMRKEQVSELFAKTLGWNSQQKKTFITRPKDATLPLSEGSFVPGVYVMPPKTSPQDAQTLINERFITDILSRYGAAAQEKMGIEQVLTIASLIQRETIGTKDMRLVSGIIWNRLFTNMNLQLDASLQYAKANNPAEAEWWPKVVPADKFIASPYNTYRNNGLPPAPIANPSVAAILAALNPIKTPCLFYVNDPKGNIHCSVTYDEHLEKIRKFYK